MKFDDISFEKSKVDLILNLSLQVELSDGKRFRALRQLSEFIALLEFAYFSSDERVWASLNKLVLSLSSSDLRKLQSLGVKWLQAGTIGIDKMQMDLHATVESKININATHSLIEPHYRIYRGAQVA